MVKTIIINKVAVMRRREKNKYKLTLIIYNYQVSKDLNPEDVLSYLKPVACVKI